VAASCGVEGAIHDDTWGFVNEREKLDVVAGVELQLCGVVNARIPRGRIVWARHGTAKLRLPRPVEQRLTSCPALSRSVVV
jgi:hypothetical protein